MKPIYLSVLFALIISMVGCGEKTSGEKSADKATASQANQHAPEIKLSVTPTQFSEIKKKAEAGEAKAQYELSVMYANGAGAPKNAAKAVEWMQKAATHGQVDAQYTLAFMYNNGNGVPKDAVQAVKWFKKAAEQGNTSALFNLGVMYYKGDGVSKDMVRAYALIELAVAQGKVEGKKVRDMLEHDLTAAELAEGKHLVANWKKGDTSLRR